MNTFGEIMFTLVSRWWLELNRTSDGQKFSSAPKKVPCYIQAITIKSSNRRICSAL